MSFNGSLILEQDIETRNMIFLENGQLVFWSDFQDKFKSSLGDVLTVGVHNASFFAP